jgi:flagellar capping protein FliD
MITSLLGNNGIIQQKTASISQQLTDTAKKTTTTQASIDAEATALRNQYTNTLQAYLTAQQQYSTLLGTTTSTTSSTLSTG